MVLSPPSGLWSTWKHACSIMNSAIPTLRRGVGQLPRWMMTTGEHLDLMSECRRWIGYPLCTAPVYMYKDVEPPSVSSTRCHSFSYITEQSKLPPTRSQATILVNHTAPTSALPPTRHPNFITTPQCPAATAAKQAPPLRQHRFLPHHS